MRTEIDCRPYSVTDAGSPTRGIVEISLNGWKPCVVREIAVDVPLLTYLDCEGLSIGSGGEFWLASAGNAPAHVLIEASPQAALNNRTASSHSNR